MLVSSNSIYAAEQLYPNPLENKLNIAISNDTKGTGKIAVYELTGRTVSRQTVVKHDKVLNAVVNMNNLVPGMYVVEIKIGDYEFTKTVMKK